mmetsp:Transcript_4949/g.17929  ORF Transcript_4949/g.17929 Transcript_4949/m.17929 type:complete len:413 (+) Transcript_4949:379-1617(+)
MRQALDFAGHRGEPASLLAGARRFHGSVQREDVGLEGDAVDHADDVADLLRAGADLLHGLDDLGDDGAAVAGRLACRHGDACGTAGQIAGALERRGDLFHRGSSVLQAGGGAGRAVGQVGVAVGDRAGVLRHFAGGGRHVTNDAGQRGLHVLHGLQHLAELVATLDLDVLRQVAIGDGLGGLLRLAGRADDGAGDVDAATNANQRGHRHQHHGEHDRRAGQVATRRSEVMGVAELQVDQVLQALLERGLGGAQVGDQAFTRFIGRAIGLHLLELLQRGNELRLACTDLGDDGLFLVILGGLFQADELLFGLLQRACDRGLLLLDRAGGVQQQQIPYRTGNDVDLAFELVGCCNLQQAGVGGAVQVVGQALGVRSTKDADGHQQQNQQAKAHEESLANAQLSQEVHAVQVLVR